MNIGEKILKPKILRITTFSSEVSFQDQLSFLSDDFSLEIELISHQKQSKVHLQNELWKFYLYKVDAENQRES